MGDLVVAVSCGCFLCLRGHVLAWRWRWLVARETNVMAGWEFCVDCAFFVLLFCGVCCARLGRRDNALDGCVAGVVEEPMGMGLNKMGMVREGAAAWL